MLTSELIQSTSSWPFVEIRKLLKDRKEIIKKKNKIIFAGNLERFGAKRELNWRPKINIKELVREMVEFELNTKKTKN